MKKAKKVRLLLTVCDIDVRRGCPVTVKIYRMRSISFEEAMNLLEKEMSNGMDKELNSNQLSSLIDICGGIPLMLTLVVAVLFSEDDKQKA